MNAQDMEKEVEKILAKFEKPNLLSRQALIGNLTWLYYAIKASEHLLECAIVESDKGPVRDYYFDHLKEEQGHAQWLKEDLAGAGIVVEDIPIPTTVAAMCGSVYYRIFHQGPTALLGYMLVMENPVEMKVVEMLEGIHGKGLLRTTRYHAENDVEHRKDLVQVINARDDWDKKIILTTAVEAANLLGIGLQTRARTWA